MNQPMKLGMTLGMTIGRSNRAVDVNYVGMRELLLELMIPAGIFAIKIIVTLLVVLR